MVNGTESALESSVDSDAAWRPLLLRASERSERSEHTVVLSLTFLSIYI